jgi:2,3-bisphosphoglycerate-dependent phosphoglycerate mutase
MSTLLLLRHGQSQWNLENRFTGWSDVPLTERGRADAVLVGSALKGFSFDTAWSSRLQRANDTLSILLTEMGATLSFERDSALNERHYGDLQGLNKAEIAEQYGQEQVQLWRRNYDTRPPNGESMADCERRTLPFFMQYIFPSLAQGNNMIIAAHGNSLRPIIKFLEGLTPDAAATLEIGLCTPYIYTFEGEKVVKKEIREVSGIVTLGASTTQKNVASGRL